MKDKEIYGLSKIPDSVLLKLSQQEVGELKSLIDELQYKVEEMTKLNQMQQAQQAVCCECNKDARLIVRREELYKNITAQNAELRSQIKKMRENTDRLLARCYKLEQRITELEQMQQK